MKSKLLTILTSIILSCLCLFTLTACENGDNGGDTPPTHEHSFTNYISDNNATCTVNGTETATCDNCIETDTREKLNSKLGHSFTNYISDNNATCTVNGTETATCDNCIETDTREKLNSKLGHSFTSYVSDNNATCTANGTKTAVCNRNGCNETDTIIDVNSKLGHSFTNYISDNNATYDADGTKTAKCDNCEATDTIVDEGSKLTSQTGQISFSTLSLDRLNAYGAVSNKTEEFNFNNEVTVSGNATYVVSYDKYGSQQVLTKIVPIYTGNNTFYVFEMQGTNITKTYEVTIRRRPIYNVSFNTLGSYVESQSIEEDSLATEPTIIPTRAGYTFDGWDYDFTTPITKNETVTALWTANDNTPYTVEYYLENLENEEYTLTQTNNLTGVTDTTAYAEIKTFEHFTAEKQTVSGNINGNGTTVLKVYYQRNEYTVSNADKSLGSITGAGKYKYGKQITLQSSPILGYNVNWYSSEELLSDSLCYTVTIDKDITAKFAIKPEMANFNFTSTATTCVISGVKNKTITEILIPDSVTSIGNFAFYGCSSLTSVVIGNSVTSICEDAFAGCHKLTSIMVDENNENYKSIDGNLYSKDGKTLIQYAMGKTDTAFTIPNSVTSIGEQAFYICTSLTSVTIGNSVISICEDAFRGCYSLTIYCEATYKPSGWSSDWNYSNCPVVWNCNNNEVAEDGYIYTVVDGIRYGLKDGVANIVRQLRNITIASIPIKVTHKGTNYTVTSIGEDAFENCDNLTSIEIPNSVTSIGSYAFYGCSSLTSIEIPNSVTSIGSYAFRSCDSLTSIEIPDSVTSIGDGAFYDCSSLTSIEIPNSVTSIGDWAFYDCSSLTSIEIPNSVISIGNYAFCSCDSLTSIEIPNSVTSIGSNAFADCESLTSIMVDENNENYKLIDGNLYSKDGKTLIQYAIGKTDTAFTIPNSVTSIGSNAFRNCDSLTSVVIGDSVTSIDYYAFAYCDSLTSIKYTGTQTQWSAISKGSYWNRYTGNYTITYNYTGD